MMFIEKLPKKATLSLGKIDEYEYLTGEEITNNKSKTNNRTNFLKNKPKQLEIKEKN